MHTGHIKYMRMRIKPNTVLARGCDIGTTQLLSTVLFISLSLGALLHEEYVWSVSNNAHSTNTGELQPQSIPSGPSSEMVYCLINGPDLQ